MISLQLSMDQIKGLSALSMKIRQAQQPLNKIKLFKRRDRNVKNNELTGAGCLIFNLKTNRLLVVRGPEKWSLPKGHMEGNELPHQTAMRETYEETSLVINLLKTHKSKKLKKYLYYYVLIDEEPPILSPIDKNEVFEVKWCDLNELQNLDCNQQLKYFIQRWTQIINTMRNYKNVILIKPNYHNFTKTDF